MRRSLISRPLASRAEKSSNVGAGGDTVCCIVVLCFELNPLFAGKDMFFSSDSKGKDGFCGQKG